MIAKVTSKRQVTFPKKVMESLNLKAGDTISLLPTPDGILVRPHRFDSSKLAPLRDKIQEDFPSPNLKEIRHAASVDSSIRD